MNFGAAVVWASEAACAGQYELFDTAAEPPRSASASRVRVHARAVVAARRICRTCPVLRLCEDASIGEDVGFLAGMTELERETRWCAARSLGDQGTGGELAERVGILGGLGEAGLARVKTRRPVAVITYSTVDHGPPLPVSTSSGRTIFDDLARLEASRRLSPIRLQPLTREETGALQRRAGQPWPSTVRKLAPGVEQVVRLYRDGVSVRQVAGRLGCSCRTVRRQLGVAGEPIRKPVVDVGRDEAIVAAFRSGASVAQIGARFGCTRDVIRNRLGKAGISPSGERRAGLATGVGR